MWIHGLLFPRDGQLTQPDRSWHGETLSFTHRLLDKEEEQELLVRAQRGEVAARNALIEHNLRLIASYLRDRRRSLRGLDATERECFGDLCLGLIRATEKFDVEKGLRFGTYARHWLRSSLGDALASFRRHTRGKTDRLRKMFSVRNRLRLELMREPNRTEVAHALDMSEEQLENMLLATPLILSFHGVRFVPESVMPRSLISRDGIPDSADDTPETWGISESLNQPSNAEDAVSAKEQRQLLLDAIAAAGLTPFEERIITLRFQEEPLTLKQVGDQVGGFSRERIRQLQDQALGKIRRAFNQLEKQGAAA